jgi:hypothetical protein
MMMLVVRSMDIWMLCGLVARVQVVVSVAIRGIAARAIT